ncbi:MAG: glycosyltransferase [Clostridia bacterium]|nr:glycosyltransferase [Clostridia bacterium]
MDKNCLVSAIITTHKREPIIIERAIKSILNQTYKNLEIIVVDDSPNSYDLRESVKLLVESYADYGVKYIQHDTCQGACVARNTGLFHANGEYIGYLDDDDEWLPEKIEKQLQCFTNDDIALVYCGRETFDEANNYIKTSTTLFLKDDVFNFLIRKNFIGSTSFPLIRRKHLLEINGFDPQMQSAQDYDVWLRLARNHKINYCEDVLVRYYIHEGEQISKNPQKVISGLERLVSKNYDYIKSSNIAYWFRWREIIPFYVRNGQTLRAIKIWLKCCFKCIWKVKSNFIMGYLILRFYFARKKIKRKNQVL